MWICIAASLWPQKWPLLIFQHLDKQKTQTKRVPEEKEDMLLNVFKSKTRARHEARRDPSKAIVHDTLRKQAQECKGTFRKNFRLFSHKHIGNIHTFTFEMFTHIQTIENSTNFKFSVVWMRMWRCMCVCSDSLNYFLNGPLYQDTLEYLMSIRSGLGMHLKQDGHPETSGWPRGYLSHDSTAGRTFKDLWVSFLTRT